ncbi:N-acetyltransferase [Aquimarina sp. RZ0]|uniref:GNAT family N-acetyltransferase n=1 Tax=Aquimarina sp. RZ0 TaxID=2607730 RepID=UPI0011F278F7|nr:GNAT family N-acetyltransferase [Aquimarina sp. RZ0]KAA1243157.1 GNAT family N-acetyltransferase [Aquimarina sp. RZ0]
MHTETVFKKCTTDDIDDLIVISQQFYPEHYSHIWKNNDTSYYINLSFTKTAFEKDFKTENISYYIIKKANRNVGLLKLREHQGFDKYPTSESIQLEKIYLLKSATGSGIGKEAINFTKKRATLLSKKIIWLDVMTTSPALHFYQKTGFTTVTYYHLDYPGLKDGYREMQRMLLEIKL